MEGVQIRDLKAKDVKTVAKMFGRLSRSNLSEILNATRTAGDKDPAEVGISLIKMFSAELVDDLYAWLADLASMTPEEFDEQDFKFPVEVLRQLISKAGFADFFGGAIEQAKRQMESSITSTLSNVDTDGQMG